MTLLPPGRPIPEGEFQVLWRLFPGRLAGNDPHQFERALDSHPELVWVHTSSAGIDHLAELFQDRPSITLTHSAGVVAQPIAEFALGCLLQHCKRWDQLRRLQAERRFESLALRELADLRVAVFGLGAIGSRLAHLLQAAGTTVVGVRRHPSRPVPPGVSRVYPPQQLANACQGADALVLAAPLTQATRHAVGGAVLAALAEGSVLINVARGALLDEAALAPALASGRPAAAYLDAFEEEPLPTDSALWALAGAYLSPHVSWSSPNFARRTSQFFGEQLQRWLRGESLLNRASPSAGY
ncbi:MAG: D-2-hydroxyacid dehydrogenase [Candidatus Dormibacteria bacterium]